MSYLCQIKVIAQTLLDMGVEVLHIRRNGQVEKAGRQLNLTI